MRILLGAWVLIALAGCARLPVQSGAELWRDVEPLRRFELDGRISVVTGQERLSGSLAWTRDDATERMLLSGPLGQGAIELTRQDSLVSLRAANGDVLTESSVERLMDRALGLPLPAEALVYWLSAVPRPGVVFQAEGDEQGRLATLQQDGWRIEYGRYRQRDGRWLPGRLFASRGEIEFRLVIDVWVPR